MNFQEAESRFRWLSDELAAHRITEAQYRAGVNEIRVTDERGGLWMMQERTGQWHLYNGTQWIAATPPRPAGPPPPLPPTAMPAPPVAEASGGGCGKTAMYLVGWAVVFIAIAAAVLYFAPKENVGTALLVVGAVALFSLISMLSSLNSAWQGQIVDIHEESYRRKSGNRWYTERRTVAVIREPGGKTRKVGASRGWRVGDYLEKRRGDTSIHRR